MSEKEKSAPKKRLANKASKITEVPPDSPLAAPAKKRSSSTTTRKKAPSTARQTKHDDISPSRDLIEIAAYLNWCGRRNQGLPDDAFADWISAETVTGLAN